MWPGVCLTLEEGRAWARGGHLEQPTPMCDELEPIDAERFLLGGRLADLVNIAGKRSSLSYLTHQLNSIAGVEDGVFFFPEEPHPSQAGSRAGRGGGGGARARCGAAHRGAAPADRCGVSAAAAPSGGAPAAQQHRQAAPRGVALARRDSGGGRGAAGGLMTAIALRIAADHPAFDGHFPGAPVLPGVVLLDAAIRAIELADGGEPRCWRVTSVKFLRMVGPGAALVLEPERLAGGLRFTILSAGQAVASGALSLES